MRSLPWVINKYYFSLKKPYLFGAFLYFLNKLCGVRRYPNRSKCHTPYSPTNFYLKEKSNLQFKWKKPKSHHASWAFHILKTPNFEWSRKQNKEKLKTAANREILSFEIWYRNIISFYISVRWALSQVLKKPLKNKFQHKLPAYDSQANYIITYCWVCSY